MFNKHILFVDSMGALEDGRAESPIRRLQPSDRPPPTRYKIQQSPPDRPRRRNDAETESDGRVTRGRAGKAQRTV